MAIEGNHLYLEAVMLNVCDIQRRHFCVVDIQQRQKNVKMTFLLTYYYTRYCTNLKLIVNSCFSSSVPPI